MHGLLAARQTPFVQFACVCMHACLRAMCYAYLALRVRDLARVEGPVVAGDAGGGGGGLAATRMLGWPVVRQRRMVSRTLECMHCAPRAWLNACEIAHA